MQDAYRSETRFKKDVFCNGGGSRCEGKVIIILILFLLFLLEIKLHMCPVSVGKSVYHNFLKGREVTVPCSYSTCYYYHYYYYLSLLLVLLLLHYYYDYYILGWNYVGADGNVMQTNTGKQTHTQMQVIKHRLANTDNTSKQTQVSKHTYKYK